MNIIGIDPGINGAITFLNEDGTYKIFTIPTKAENRRGGRKIDISSLHNILTNCDFHNTIVYIEKAQAFPGQGVVSMFNYGIAYGILLSLIHIYPFAGVRYIPPSEWKQYFWILGKKKEGVHASTKRDWFLDVASYMREYNINLIVEMNEDGKKTTKRAISDAEDSYMIARFGFFNQSKDFPELNMIMANIKQKL